MEESGFFGSNNGDRKYKSELIATFLSKLFSNGVFNNELQVVANDDMSITLKQGLAFLNGYFYYNPSDKVINISLSDSEQSRIDSIVIRYSKENRQITADVLEGLYSSNPVPPELTRNANIYELRLCNISVEKQTDKITTSMIEDRRFNTTDCGQVISAVQHLDTTDVFAQYENYFNEWFVNLQTQLSGDVAVNLQTQIDEIIKSMEGISNNIFYQEEGEWELDEDYE